MCFLCARVQPSVGLREAEIRLATRTIKRGLPCLQLFGDRGGQEPRVYDRHADIYDSFADMFSVLTVRSPPPPLLWAVQQDTLNPYAKPVQVEIASVIFMHGQDFLSASCSAFCKGGAQ